MLKTDLRQNATVVQKLGECKLHPLTYEECAAFAQKYGLAHIEVSALTGEGIATVMADLVDLGIEASPEYVKLHKKSARERFWSTVRAWIGAGGKTTS